jgi:hypothetical protein
MVGNFVHIILFFIITLLLIFKFKAFDKVIIFYGLALVSSYLLFAFLLKWQPWQTRLDLPFFIVLSPLITLVFCKLNLKKISTVLSLFLLTVAILLIFIYEPTKPILGKNSVFFKSNKSYVFGYDATEKIINEIEKNNISNIGLIIGGDSLEWQYWFLSKDKRFEYIFFNKDLLKTHNFDNQFKYRAIVVDNSMLSMSKIKKFISLSEENISEILSIDEKVTLIILKKEQNNTLQY